MAGVIASLATPEVSAQIRLYFASFDDPFIHPPSAPLYSTARPDRCIIHAPSTTQALLCARVSLYAVYIHSNHQVYKQDFAPVDSPAKPFIPATSLTSLRILFHPEPNVILASLSLATHTYTVASLCFHLVQPPPHRQTFRCPSSRLSSRPVSRALPCSVCACSFTYPTLPTPTLCVPHIHIGHCQPLVQRPLARPLTPSCISWSSTKE